MGAGSDTSGLYYVFKLGAKSASVLQIQLKE